MHEYYFKLKKGELEFEFSTTDKATFEEKLTDWVSAINNNSKLPSPEKQQDEQTIIEEKPNRNGFIDVKTTTSINDIQTPDFSLHTEPNNEFLNFSEFNFEEELQKSMENPKTEVIEKQENMTDFESYISKFSPENNIDYLIATAMFILNNEQQERFTIKQLNAKLVPLNGKPIDHSIMQESIEQGLIRVVPDLTGTNEFTEYTLTPDGEGYFVL